MDKSDVFYNTSPATIADLLMDYTKTVMDVRIAPRRVVIYLKHSLSLFDLKNIACLIMESTNIPLDNFQCEIGAVKIEVYHTYEEDQFN